MKNAMNWFERNRLADKVGGVCKLADLMGRTAPTVRKWLDDPARTSTAREPKDYDLEKLVRLAGTLSHEGPGEASAD